MSPGSCVLVGVGRSWHADEAVRWALAEARSRGTRLHLVRACGSTRAEREDAADVLAETAARCRRLSPDVPVTREVVEDGPVRALADRATVAELVVVGRSPRSLLDPVLGTVGTNLAGRVGVPVVVVRGEHGRERPTDWPVLAALLRADDADAVLELACTAAAREGRPLVVVHALPPGPGLPLLPGVERQWSERAAWLCPAASRWQKAFPDVRMRADLAVDAPERAILERTAHSALAVLGVRRLSSAAGGLWRHLPPLTPIGRPLELVATDAAHCPVVLVPLHPTTAHDPTDAMVGAEPRGRR